MFGYARSLFAAAALALSAMPALSASVSVTDVDGTWGGPIPPNVVGLSGVGTSTMSWGRPWTQGGAQSAYGFTGSPVGLIETDVAFDLGVFTHFNNPIAIRRANSSIRAAQLSVSIQIDLGDGAGPTQIDTVFDFLHDETRNSPLGPQDPLGGTCANGPNGVGVNVNGCADRVRLVRNDALSTEFTIDGVLYALDITGFLFEGSLLTEFWTQEEATNSAVLRGILRTVGTPPEAPVPLPAAGWLLIAGVGALALTRRRRG